MQRQLLNHPKLSVLRITGTEGPRNDPYGYVEYYIKTPRGCTVIHIGLAVFVKVGSQRVDARGKDYDEPFTWADRWLLEEIGFTLKQLTRIAYKSKATCSKGGYHDVSMLPGYPGETLCVCGKCHKVVHTYFCEGDVQ